MTLRRRYRPTWRDNLRAAGWAGVLAATVGSYLARLFNERAANRAAQNRS